jgi:hypothetical protein
MNTQDNHTIERITDNGKLLGFIQQEDDFWIANIDGHEFEFDTRKEAIQTVYDVNSYY